MSIQYYKLNESSIVGEYYVYVCVYVTCVNIAPVHTIVYIVIIVQQYVSMYYCKHQNYSHQYYYGLALHMSFCVFMDKMYMSILLST